MLAFSTTLNGSFKFAFATAVHEMMYYVDPINKGISEEVYVQALKNLGLRKNNKRTGNLVAEMIRDSAERTPDEILAYSVDAYASGKANDLANAIISVLRERGVLN